MFFLYLLENFCIKYLENTKENGKNFSNFSNFENFPVSSDLLFKLLCKKLSEIGIFDSLTFLDKIEFYREKYTKLWTSFLKSTFQTTTNSNGHSSKLSKALSAKNNNNSPSISPVNLKASSNFVNNSPKHPKSISSNNSLVKSSSQGPNTISLSISQEEIANSSTGITNKVSRYENDFIEEEKLGQGGFGAVFRVYRTLDQSHYAIKKIKFRKAKSPLKLPEKVSREVRCLAHSEHINVVRYYNAWLEYHIATPSPPQTSFHSSSKQKKKLKNNYHDYDTNNNNINNINDDDFDDDKNNYDDYDDEDESGSGSSEGEDLIFDVDEETPVNSITCSSNDSFSQVNPSGAPRDVNALSAHPTNHSLHASSDSPVEYQVTLYIQMQLCSFSLKEWLEREPRLVDPQENIVIFKQILSGLAYIHSLGLIHRDLKPSSFFFLIIYYFLIFILFLFK